MQLRLIVGLGTLLGIAATAVPCNAQQPALLPSDVELASAYCIGVLQRQAAMADERVLKSPGAGDYATQQIEHRHLLRHAQRIVPRQDDRRCTEVRMRAERRQVRQQLRVVGTE